MGPIMSIKFVVVGPGLIGKKHIALIQANPEAKLISIVAPDHQQNHEIARDEGVPLFHSLSQCEQELEIDAVIISSPNEFHFEQALWCIERNIPVLIEKPVTVSIEEALQLNEVAKSKNAKVLVGHHRAYSTLLAFAQDIIESGRLGRLVSFVGGAQFYKPEKYFQDGAWRANLGGGPILINMIHEVGNMRALIGEIVEVQAMASTEIRQFPVEDTVVMSLRFDNGVLGTFILSDAAASPMSWEQTARENPAYPSYRDVDCYTISGTRGTLGFPTMRLKVFPPESESNWWMPMIEEKFHVKNEDPLERQLRHFIDLISGRQSAKVSVEDGYKNLLAIKAIQDAIKYGHSIKVGA